LFTELGFYFGELAMEKEGIYLVVSAYN